MKFLSNLFGGAKKALRAEITKLRAELGSSETQIRKDMTAMEARLKVAFAAAVRAAIADAPEILADVVKAAAEGQPKA